MGDPGLSLKSLQCWTITESLVYTGVQSKPSPEAPAVSLGAKGVADASVAPNPCYNLEESWRAAELRCWFLVCYLSSKVVLNTITKRLFSPLCI